MVTGIFVDNTPYIQVTLAWGSFVKNYWFILDTGFTGDLQVPSFFAQELKLTINSIEPVTIANGQKVNVPQSLAIAAMEGTANYMQVGISNGPPLAGIRFLTKFGYRAMVNCKHRTVILDKP